MEAEKVNRWVERTREVVQRMCTFHKSFDPDVVGNRVIDAGLEFMSLTEMEVSEISQCLGVNWNFAQSLKGHARTERSQLYERGVCFRCNLCGAKFAYREMLRRHSSALHDEGDLVVKQEPKLEVFNVEDRSNEEGQENQGGASPASSGRPLARPGMVSPPSEGGSPNQRGLSPTRGGGKDGQKLSQGVCPFLISSFSLFGSRETQGSKLANTSK